MVEVVSGFPVQRVTHKPTEAVAERLRADAVARDEEFAL